jgi:photosystem II stability/assembly factor-like uncharacterized protein
MFYIEQNLIMKKTLFIFFLSLIFTNCYSQWTKTSGPEGGNVNCMVYTDSAIYIGCTDFGGIFKSTDDGNNWFRVGNIPPSYRDIRALILRNNIFLAVTFNGLIRSTDGGNSWVYLSSSIAGYLAYNDHFIFGAAFSGIVRSSDNGSTWTPINNGLLDLDVNVIKTVGSNIYAGTYAGIFLSTDNGDNWNLISQNLSFPIINDLIVNGDTIYAGTSFGGMNLTTDNGISWSNINPNTSYTNPQIIVFENNKLYVSLYGGGIYYTTDNGGNWQTINNGLPVYPIMRTLHVNNNSLITGGYHYGMFRSDSSGTNWESSNSGLTATTIFAIEKCDRGILATNGGSIYITTNGGNNWSFSNIGIYCSYITVLEKYNNIIYAGTSECGVWKSTDDGASWNALNFGLPNNLGVNAITINDQYLFIATSQGIFYSDTNNVWLRVNTFGNTEFFAIEFLDSGLFAANDYVYRSLDNGHTWIQTNIGISVGSHITNFEFLQNKIFASGFNGVFSSTNNGNSWSAANSGLGDNFINAFIKHNNYLILSTLFTGNYYSSNTGQSWIHLQNGLSSPTNCMVSADSIIYAGTQGDAVYKLNFNTVNISNLSGNIPEKFILSQNYPNPFNPSTNIRYEIPKSGFVKLVVFDLIGKEIETLVNEKQSPGIYEINFNASRYPSGVYFYKLTTGNYVETKKMFLIK